MSRIRTPPRSLAIVLLFIFLPVPTSAHDPHEDGHNDGSCSEASCVVNDGDFADLYSFTSAVWSSGPSLKLSLTGTYDLREQVLGIPGAFIADITVYEDLAILGSQVLGVLVLDISDPSAPTLLSNVLQHVPPGTFPEFSRFEDVEVSRIGDSDVLVVGLQGHAGANGIAMFDITDPFLPTLLSKFLVPAEGGVHELDVGKTSDGRTLAFLGALDQENFTSSPRRGDTFIIDISDPVQPVQIAEWGFQDEAMLGDALADSIQALGGDVHGAHHSARMSASGELLYVSHWDGGFITLDISDPASPVFAGRILEYEDLYPNVELDVNAHSVAEAFGGSILLTAQEYGSSTSWGKLKLWDVRNPANPLFLSEFGSDAPPDAEGSRTVHNPEVVGNLVYTSWSRDGFRVIDISDPTQPKEAASFKSNTVIETPTDVPFDYNWGVSPKGNYAFLSNGLFGLQVLAAWYFTGFAEPVSNTSWTPLKAGQTVALRWRLTGANDGAPIMSLTTVVVTTTAIDCDDGSPMGGDPITEAASILLLDLGGGATHTADFRFK